jgi:phage-related protein (TIGR01555 family)
MTKTTAPAKRPPLNVRAVTQVDGAPPVEIERRNTYAPAEPLPGVLPAGVTLDNGMAVDSQVITAYGWANNSLSSGAYGSGITWVGYPALADLAQIPEYRRPAEILAKEMTREWVKLISRSADTEKADRIKALNDAIEKYGLQKLFEKVAETDGYFGRAQLYVDMGDDSDGELTKPLVVDKRKIKPGMLKGFKLVEPIWTYPGQYDASNPLSRTFYKPTTWYVMGKTVHATRLLTFVARPVPDLLKPAYSFGGISLSQLAIPYVNNWLRTRQSVSDIINMFSTSVLATNMESIIQEGADSGSLMNRLALFTMTRSNRGVMAIDKETETFENVAAPLASLDKLQAQSQEQMASVNGIPLVVLLGITPSGLNASSDGEIRAFYAWIKAQQEQFFTPNLRTALDIIQLSEFGEIDPDITFEWVQLWQPDETEEAGIRKMWADGDVALIDAGVVSPEEVRDRVAKDPKMGFDGIDLSAPPPEPLAEEGFGEEGDDQGFGQDAEWSEADHPRAPDGKFGSGTGGGASGSEGQTASPFERPNLPKSGEVGNPFKSWADAESKGGPALEAFTKSLDDVAKTMGLSTGTADKHGNLHDAGDGKPFLVIAPNKSQARAEEKVRKDYKDDWSQLKDMVRGSVVLNSMAELREAFTAAEKAGLEFAAQPKDRFAKPTAEGYRDLNTLVKLPNGMVGELQFHVREMSDAKAMGHRFYEEQRSLTAKNGSDEPNAKWSKQDTDNFNELRAAQQAIYNEAWAKVT